VTTTDVHRAGGDTGQPDVSQSRSRRHRRAAPSHVRAGLRYCVGVFLTVRVAVAVVALMAVAMLPDLSSLSPTVRSRFAIPSPVSVPGWPAHAVTPGWHNLFTSFERFDALWYLRIAAHGYRNGDGSAAFYPLYPALTRAVGYLTGGHPLAGALIVSNLSFLGALFVLYLLGSRELDEPAARRAVLYAAVFPTAVFFFAPYSESTFLLLALLAFWWARSERWTLTAMAAFLAALTRNVGVLLVLPLAAEAAHQTKGRSPRRIPLGGVLASLAPLLGTGGYLVYWHHLSGDWLAPLHQQVQWQRHLTDPALAVVHGSQIAFRFVGAYPGGYHFYDWVVAIPVLSLAVYAAARFRPAYGVYTWASILVPLSFVFDGRPLMSFPRFALVVFPIFWALALFTRDRPLRHEAVVTCSALLLGVSTLLFATWYYIF
jgi:Mannosyltransferase (PIG-V)